MNRKGLAIPLVLIFATVLGLIGGYVFKNTAQYNTQNRTGLSQLQAHFVARAAFQHAMLKIKFLHRELYDSACLSQGLNPLFDFSKTDPSAISGSINDYNKGPIFLYKSGEFSRNGLYTNSFNPLMPDSKTKDWWLNKFQEDIASGILIDGVMYNSCMNLNPPANNVKSLMREPFTGVYQMTSLKQLARETNEDTADVGNYAIIEMTVESSINNAKDQNFNYKMKKTIKVSRYAM